MTKWIGLAAVLMLAGCATQSAPSWQKPGAGQADLDNVQASCTSEATQKFPVQTKQVQTSAAYNTQPGSGCGFTPGSSNTSEGYSAGVCASTGTYVAGQTADKDVNLAARNQELSNCMKQQGWSPAS